MALVCNVYCAFVTFPFGILGQKLNLNSSVPGPCCLSYFTLYSNTYTSMAYIIQCENRLSRNNKKNI